LEIVEKKNICFLLLKIMAGEHNKKSKLRKNVINAISLGKLTPYNHHRVLNNLLTHHHSYHHHFGNGLSLRNDYNRW
jgi:hypothetical protein